MPALLVAATPAVAESDKKGFFTLANTDYVVVISFLIFIGALFYLRVPSLLMGMLDKRADGIRSDLEEARKLREEAQSLLASFERKQKDVQEQADRIVAQARDEAQTAADRAKEDIKTSVARRLAAAGDQIASAEAAAVREVRDQAIAVATKAAREVIAAQTGAEDQARLIDEAIATVGAKLH